jgi:hypothetical protein
MKIYDKAAWHIDNGESREDVLEKFRLVFEYLERHGWLSPDGQEILGLGIDASVSLNEAMTTPAGKAFLDAEYDNCLALSLVALRRKLAD